MNGATAGRVYRPRKPFADDRTRLWLQPGRHHSDHRHLELRPRQVEQVRRNTMGGQPRQNVPQSISRIDRAARRTKPRFALRLEKHATSHVNEFAMLQPSAVALVQHGVAGFLALRRDHVVRKLTLAHLEDRCARSIRGGHSRSKSEREAASIRTR
jgi:hypothetical protein